MNSGNHSQSSFSHPNVSPQSTRSGPSQYQGSHNRDSSSSTHHSGQSQVMSPTFYQSGGQGSKVDLDRPDMTIGQLSVYLQERLAQLQTRIKHTPGIPTNVQNLLIEECRTIGQEFNEQQRHLKHQIEVIQNENIQLSAQLLDAQEKLKTSIQDRDTLQSRVDKLLQEAEKSDKEWDIAMQHLQATNASLMEKIAMQEEQLKGKRALWLDSNPHASAQRRDAMKATIRDPFHSPSASGNSGVGSQMSNIDSPAPSPLKSSFSGTFSGPPPQMAPSGAPTGPAIPRGPRRRAHLNIQLPVGKAEQRSHMALPASWQKFPSTANKIFNTEPGDTPPAPPPSMALVVHTKAEDPAEDYTNAFGKLYALIEGWVKTYANEPNVTNDQKVARSNDVLWAYMMNCTYPGHRQDSHTHVMALLSEPQTRYWFMMRMCVTYCVKDIISIKTFYSYSDLVNKQLEEVRTKLQERGKSDRTSMTVEMLIVFQGLANEARQGLVDQQARAVQSIISAGNYQAYRSTQLAYHTKRLRDMLGPMLNDNISRQAAGKDLGAIAVTAWELSVKMHTSHLTFQVYFPETAAKFMAATMVAKDQPHTDPMELQIRQTRLKLVITPVITMRDDRGTTIKAKNLHHSTVLTMM
ncbi:hypothetical protein G7Y89_g9866 [Cudoniella acicularis]|uniref:Uncharacterized protein n=1 Tax=Cudoniella acicularis TaxID=354080 RepID=A0A8H4RGL3_9HELO|nr:hypothetical protein G7Y89_g9866 [Cudoniella acicularis]